MKIKELSLSLTFLLAACQTDTDVTFTVESAKEKTDKFLNHLIKNEVDSLLSVTAEITKADIESGKAISDSLLGEITNTRYVKADIEKTIEHSGRKKVSLKVYYELSRVKKNSYRIFYLEPINDTLKIVGYDDKFDLDNN